LLSARRSANSGIFGAQDPTMNPFIRKSSETAALFLVIKPPLTIGAVFT
jgi:hypothetical protein